MNDQNGFFFGRSPAREHEASSLSEGQSTDAANSKRSSEKWQIDSFLVIVPIPVVPLYFARGQRLPPQVSREAREPTKLGLRR